MKKDQQPRDLGPCPLCGRPMLKGDSVERHHWQPKSLGGRKAAYLHRICHRKLHSLLDCKELTVEFATPDKVRQHLEMQKFIRWVRTQPPERVLRHRKPRRGHRGAGISDPLPPR
jgi:hypothetical protein